MHDDLIMEIALLIENEDEYVDKYVGSYKISWGSKNNGLKEVNDFLLKYKNRNIEYIYFGNEFCEYKIPTIAQVQRMIDFCVRERLKLVLVTPVVTEFGINHISLLIDYLKKENLFLDIVVNDIGVLELIHQKLFDCNIILGRVFDKTSHDSRALTVELDRYYGEMGKKFAMSPGVISANALLVFKKYGIERFEFDLPKIGLELPSGYNFSLYWPYSYLTTGRVCLFRSLELEGKEKFLVGKTMCKRSCMKYQIEKRKPINGYAVENNKRITELYLFQKGNTVFFVNDKEDCLINKFNRLIIQL